MRRILVLFIVLVLVLMGCSSGHKPVTIINGTKDKLAIQTTIYPIYYFTARIAGDKLNVNNFIPVGVEPHGWEPKPGDLVKLGQSDMLIYNGAGFENWIVDLKKSVRNDNLIVVNATEGIDLLESEDHQHHHGVIDYIKGLFGHGHSCSHGEDDPHVWLDPLKAQEIALNIKNAIIAIDPSNQLYYEANFNQLVEELLELHSNYQQGLAQVTKKEIIVTHAAFGYLTERYGLKQIPLMGTNLHSEPTPRRLAEVIELASKYDAGYVFAETLVNPKVAQTLATEANLKIGLLNPIENLTQEEVDNGEDYFSIMYKNLEVLKQALE